MPSGDRYPGRLAYRSAAREDCAHGLERQLVERYSEDRERHDRPAAHRVNIGDGVGRRDPAEIVRIVDDRHEEIGCGDDAVVIVEPPHRGVVAGLDPDEELRIRLRRGVPAEKLLQHGGGELTAAAAAMGETG